MPRANSSTKGARVVVAPVENHPNPSHWDYESRALLSPIVNGLDIPFSLLDEAWARCYLSGKVLNFLFVGRFICQVAPAAQAAQRAYRVPASFLIAKAIYETAAHASDYYDPNKGCRCREDDIYFSFMKEASQISNSPRYRSAMKLTSDPVAFAKKLCELRLYAGDDLKEILERMEQFKLAECDRAVEPGYTRGRSCQ